MDSGIASLNKILKDKTRRRIILLLHEQGSLSYVDLMKGMGIANTGRMNYHLKVLGDLLKKTEDGKYILTEKGNIAAKLLLEFPEKGSYAQTEIKLTRRVLIVAALSAVGFVTAFVLLYCRGIIDFSRMTASILVVISTMIILIVSDQVRKKKARWSPKSQIIGAEIYSIVFGALIGIAVFLIGGSLILFGFETLLQSAGIRFVLFPFAWWIIISFVLGSIIGGFAGYLIYKRSKYPKSAYDGQFA